jgi:hypothetical protein
MKDRLVKILDGKGVMQDIADLEEWGKIPKVSRCGLAKTIKETELEKVAFTFNEDMNSCEKDLKGSYENHGNVKVKFEKLQDKHNDLRY